jgi:hypothetical protein
MPQCHGLTVADPFADHVHRMFAAQFRLLRTAKVLKRLHPRLQSRIADDPREASPKVPPIAAILCDDMLGAWRAGA